MNILQKQVTSFISQCLEEDGMRLDLDGKHAFLNDIESNFRHFWVMFDDDQEIVGTIAVKEIDFNNDFADVLHRHSAEVMCLYLFSNYNNVECNEKMIGFAIDQARAFGYNFLYVSLSSAKNQTALNIYKNFGFEEISKYSDDSDSDIFLRLNL